MSHGARSASITRAPDGITTMKSITNHNLKDQSLTSFQKDQQQTRSRSSLDIPGETFLRTISQRNENDLKAEIKTKVKKGQKPKAARVDIAKKKKSKTGS